MATKSASETPIDVFEDLVRFQIEVWNAVDARLQRTLDLPVAIHQPLRIMAERGDCRVADISERLVITVGGASKIVDRLEARGLCERRANPGDRRSSLLGLTVEGEAVLERANVEVAAEVETRIAEPLGPDGFAAFGRALQFLRADAKARAQTDTDTETATDPTERADR